MNDLNLYFVVFSQHKEKQWEGYCGYIFAKNEESVTDLLNEHLGEVHVRSVQKVEVKEGSILFGERWRTL